MKDLIQGLINGNNGAIEVMNSLSDGASFRIIVQETEDTSIIKKNGSFIIIPFDPEHKPDFTINTTPEVITKVFYSTSNTDDVRSFLINSTRILMDKENRQHVSLSVHTGFFKLTMRGYLKILTLGGTQFLKTLSEYGVDSVNTIRKKLSNLTNR